MDTRNGASGEPLEPAHPSHEAMLPGSRGELHPIAGGTHPVLTTDEGVPLADDQNSLKVSSRGPTLLVYAGQPAVPRN